MLKKAIFVLLIMICLLAIQYGFSGQDNNPVARSNLHTQQTHAVNTTHSNKSRKPNSIDTTAVAISMATNESNAKVSSDQHFDRLLVAETLSNFSESEIAKMISVCQNKRHPASDTACDVVQRWSQLILRQDQDSGQMASIWLEAEQNGGKVLEESSELTPLPVEQISESSGNGEDSTQDILQNLEGKALNAPSPEERRQAIQEIILMKDAALVPVLESAINDENIENSELAFEGIKQLRAARNENTNKNLNNLSHEKAINDSHSALADIS